MATFGTGKTSDFPCEEEGLPSQAIVMARRIHRTIICFIVLSSMKGLIPF
jgi:hypothetical protein